MKFVNKGDWLSFVCKCGSMVQIYFGEIKESRFRSRIFRSAPQWNLEICPVCREEYRFYNDKFEIVSSGLFLSFESDDEDLV